VARRQLAQRPHHGVAVDGSLDITIKTQHDPRWLLATASGR
jgi:hypothetical protein